MPHPRKDDAVTSARRDRSLPSPSALCGHPRRPQHHPGHCITISSTMGGGGVTRRRHAGCCAPCGLPSAAPSSQCTDDDHTGDPYTATLEDAPGRIQGTP
jgi:hypothetical protein